MNAKLKHPAITLTTVTTRNHAISGMRSKDLVPDAISADSENLLKTLVPRFAGVLGEEGFSLTEGQLSNHNSQVVRNAFGVISGLIRITV